MGLMRFWYGVAGHRNALDETLCSGNVCTLESEL